MARRFEQTQGVDYFDTYAPVVRWNTVRLIFALAAQKNWSLQQLDVKTVFLNGVLDEEVNMQIPPGFQTQQGKVCKLIRALYRLKQALLAWYSKD